MNRARAAGSTMDAPAALSPLSRRAPLMRDPKRTHVTKSSPKRTLVKRLVVNLRTSPALYEAVRDVFPCQRMPLLALCCGCRSAADIRQTIRDERHCPLGRSPACPLYRIRSAVAHEKL